MDKLYAELEARLKKLGYAPTLGVLSIDGSHYPAARYENQNGRPMIFAVGALPKSYVRRRATAYRFGESTCDWYVACYAPSNLSSRRRFRPQLSSNDSPSREFHPFGATFQIAPWDVPSGEAIDKYHYWRGEHKPYTRVSASFEERE